MLEPSHEIIRVLSQITDKVQGSINEVSRWIIGRVPNNLKAKPQCGCQTQQLKPLYRISISKDTFNRKLSLPCIVYTDGFQMQYGTMLAANCPKTPNTNAFVRIQIPCMNIATWLSDLRMRSSMDDSPVSVSQASCLRLPR